MARFAFNPTDLQRLNRLVFLPRAISTEAESGGRRSRRAGDGGDFLDFRAYIPGDDLRNVDWSAYARLQQLFVRRSESPRQVSVSILIDASRSMAFGEPVTKLEQAQRVACALAFVAMRGGDRVFLSSFGSSVMSGVGPLTGARGLATAVRFLSSLEASGKSDLSTAVGSLRARRRDRGAVVVLSDMLNIQEREKTLLQITAAGGTLLVVQILDAIDRAEGLSGKIRLRDSESGLLVDVDLDGHGLQEFQSAFDDDCAHLDSFCNSSKRSCTRLMTRDNYLQAVCEALKNKAIMR